LKGLKIGVYKTHFNDADKEIVSCCEAALSEMVALGAEIVPIIIPHLNEFRNAHSISILSELTQKASHYPIGNYTYPTQIALSIGATISAHDFVASARFKSVGMQIMRDIFSKVDVIATPATGATAPEIPVGATDFGLSDYSSSGQIMKFIGKISLKKLIQIF
jgi:Asp-tRNA(Asn)/Glu-tRNA(Gln) amidotransferase A subunit family amidase